MPRRCSFKLELDYPQPLAGVDEAGCAPLAGPVVAGACILNRDSFPRGIDDSKNLPLPKREAIYKRLVKCSAWGVGIATVEEIDSINIYWARMLAMTRAVEALGLDPAWVLVDGNATPRWQRPSKAIVDGDAKCRSIAAASIIAKVTRDRMMAIRRPTIAARSTTSASPRCIAAASAWSAKSRRGRPSRSSS
jgi:ribonuclease HII